LDVCVFQWPVGPLTTYLVQQTRVEKAAMAAAAWTPSSWQAKPALQMAEWEDKALAKKVHEKLGSLPPLVHPSEAEALKKQLAEAGRGERFIVQGGDCAERFVDCSGERLESQIKLLLQMGLIVESNTGAPTTRIARIAGQYGKPRSKPTEVVEGYGEIMSYKGDNINGFAPEDRKWDPERLVQGYFHSAATLNYLRTFTAAADVEEVKKIDIGSLKSASNFAQIERSAQAVKAKEVTRASMEFFTAHEAMQLDLEESLTRKVGDKYYNLSAHLLWMGDRTRQLDGAHIEYFSGIRNPIGVKIGPSMKNDELKELVQKLNPEKEEGRLMLITRYGAGKVEELLTGHIKAVQESGVPVVWQCDAVHGNGIVTSNKFKSRKLDAILQELSEVMAVHKKCGSVLGGLHLEITAQPTVTEVLGGACGVTEERLAENYETACDPRLNYSQSLEAAFTVAANLPTLEPAAKKARKE